MIDLFVAMSAKVATSHRVVLILVIVTVIFAYRPARRAWRSRAFATTNTARKINRDNNRLKQGRNLWWLNVFWHAESLSFFGGLLDLDR